MSAQRSPCDVAVIGAGVAGLGTALRLAQAGVCVSVFDERAPGLNASSAAGGMLAPEAESHGQSIHLARFAYANRAMWRDYAAEIEALGDRDIAYKEDGSLIVAQTEEEAQSQRMQCQGDVREWLDVAQLRSDHPWASEELLGAAFIAGDGCVDSFALVIALHDACVRAGVNVCHSAGNVSVEVLGGKVSGIRAGADSVAAHRVLVAAGAWSSSVRVMENGIDIARAVLPPVRPVKGQIGQLSGPALPMRQFVWAGSTYLVPRRDNQLVFGATSEDAGFDEAVSPDVIGQFAEVAWRIVPAFANAPITDMWCGFRPHSPDELPSLGETPIAGLFVATGQYRNGILFAPLIADVMCALMTGKAPPFDISAFSPTRFERQHGL